MFVRNKKSVIKFENNSIAMFYNLRLKPKQ